MQELNWNNFKAKFNGKESKTFEYLCYLLFCREFDLRTGIFRYKNQAGIETEPLLLNGELIGFQAKFFDAKINPQEIKDSIEKAKNKNPKLNMIYFYINQEFSESSKKAVKEPQSKVDIENFAKSKALKIEWRVPSHIEVQLSHDENSALAQYFFSLEKGVLDFITELNDHALAILKPIHSEIIFNGASIKIDRSDTLNKLKTILEKAPIVILSGVGGVGKTALIKDFHNSIGGGDSLFIFKATEFNVNHVNELFNLYGNFTLLDFVRAHEGVGGKYVVIDSAEKLSDLGNQEPFQELLSTLLQNNWKIIFTTRYSYLDDLKFQFVEIYRLSFQILDIVDLDSNEIENLSSKYNFTLPKDERLLELLRNPFYLNEYLQNYNALPKAASLSDFKDLLWDKQIVKSSVRINNTHLKRERCFLGIAKRRADTGGFFISADDCADDILRSLETDEIIKHDSKTGGYFITHDIYEEWALDKFIERTFHNSVTHKGFFESLGSSLPIRRAFRNWLSEKLFSNRDEIKSLIEESFVSHEIESFWKDEILVSVLLSDYSEVFFQLFERVLLEDNQKILMRAIFLLRIACKEIDESFLNLLGISKKDLSSIKAVFTKPKGKGWNCAISFLYKHKEEITPSNVNIILPLLDDWNHNNKSGITTKLASLLGLYYYEEGNKQDKFRYSSRDETREQLIKIILSGSSEIKEELKDIFVEVVSKKERNYRSKYYELIRTVLSSATDSFEIAQNLPEQVIELADLFWFDNPGEESNEDKYSRILHVEDHFCISSLHLEYFPASAFQTPIFQLLRFAPSVTIDFILSFTNRTVECYSRSKFSNEVEEVEVFINDNETIRQFISARLWNAYRGTQVSTHLLESIHMALERWLLEYAKTASENELENLCRYLVKNSKSASITAVVVSAVLAQPSKLFNVAKMLFHTKEFFLYDTGRMLADQRAKSLYSMGSGLNYRHKIYEDERIKTCDDAHRKLSLEQIAFNYQFFKSEEESDQLFEGRQKVVWEFFDKYYAGLPSKAKETEADKTWRLYLARMDRRKMKPEVEEKDGQLLIKFNPELDPELKKYSEDSLKESSDALKYTSLQLWSDYRFKREESEYEKYGQYESNPQLVIKEVKEIIDGLEKRADGFSLFNRQVPAYACAVLLRDFADTLSNDDKEFCKEIILGFAAIPLRVEKYYYQILDGTEPAITSLSLLIKHFPESREDAKSLLFLLLLGPWKEVSTFAIRSLLNDLWEASFEDAQSILLGLLLLKPKYDDLTNEVLKEYYANKIIEFSGVPTSEVLKRFIERYESELENIISNKISYEELGSIEDLRLEVLNTAFELIPLKTNNGVHKALITKICSVVSEKLLEDDDDETDYTLKPRFLGKLADLILNSRKSEIEIYLKPFLDRFDGSEYIADFFQAFVSAEDRLNQYEEFWTVWNIFYPKMVDLCKARGSYHYTKQIIHNYLLAWQYWREDAKEWHTLKEREKLFFKKVAQDMGHHPSVLYSLAKLLNEIGSNFLEDGIGWISGALQNNENLFYEELERNTIHYLENIVRKHILMNRRKIRVSKQIKSQILFLLSFLIERGSVTGYLLREDIL
jgi:hypothetical protein